mmetsp:Transcript_16962/g.25457  ORF Transcript_16962/g.25457 Transcript_16962/m.25457 type:complete len:308 (-) Transcript_16962:201-1124(-)
MASANSFEVKDILALAKKAAHKAGEFVQAARVKNFVDSQKADRKLGTSFIKKSATTDIVTETDRKSEAMITKIIRDAYPSHKIIGEEASEKGGYELTSDPTWIIDPIDGTTNFVHTFPYSCILISFAFKKKIIVGVMRDAIHDETMYATKGGGCWMESPNYTGRVQTSTCQSLQTAYVFLGLGYSRTESHAINCYARIRELFKTNVQAIRVLGSCGLNMAHVACGRADGYVELDCPKIWDFSPGSLMVEEAGGWVASPEGTELDLMGRSVVCAPNEKIGKMLIKIIKEAKSYSDMTSKRIEESKAKL